MKKDTICFLLHNDKPIQNLKYVFAIYQKFSSTMEISPTGMTVQTKLPFFVSNLIKFAKLSEYSSTIQYSLT